jgi:hypothetical protein
MCAACVRAIESEKDISARFALCMRHFAAAAVSNLVCDNHGSVSVCERATSEMKASAKTKSLIKKSISFFKFKLSDRDFRAKFMLKTSASPWDMNELEKLLFSPYSSRSLAIYESLLIISFCSSSSGSNKFIDRSESH